MRILRGLVLLAIALLTLACVLVWTAPATVAYRLLRGRLGTLELGGISGSVWEGRAERVSIAAAPLGAMSWRLDKMPLLHGALHGTATLTGDDLRAQAAITAQGDRVELRNLDVDLPASALGPALDIPALTLLGRIALEVDHAELRAGLLRRAQGRASWRDFGVSGATVARLPGLAAEFRDGDDGSIQAELHDLGGPLAVVGHVRISEGKFHSETTLALREDNPQIAELLKFVGERTIDGGSLLRIEGELRPLW